MLEQGGQRVEHIGECRDEQRATVDGQRGDRQRDIKRDHDQPFANTGVAVVEAEQREHRVDDHRRGEQVQPEGDIGTAREPRLIRRVPAHREQEYADPEQQDRAEDDVLDPVVHAADRRQQQADDQRDDRSGAGGDGDRNLEALPVEPGRDGGDRGGAGSEYPAEYLVVVDRLLADAEHEQEARCSKYAADKRQQQQDRWQRHAALGGEKEGEAPRRRGDRDGAERAGSIVIDDEANRLARRLADPADRKQQDGAGDRDENIVEAVDQSKLFFVGGRAGALSVDECAERDRGIGADGTRRDRLVQILLAVHDHFPP